MSPTPAGPPRRDVLRWLILLALLTPTSAPAQTPAAEAPPLLPLAAIHEDQDRDFVPDREGQRVRVRGVLASRTEPLHERNRIGFLAEGGRGVGLFGEEDVLADFHPGDELEVEGVIASYRGLEQIRVERVTRVGRGTPPEPVRVTPSQLLGERLSGTLVHTRGVLAIDETQDVSRRFRVVAGGSEIPLYLSPPIANSPELVLDADQVGRAVEVVGFASQYERDPPYDGGYQLLVRSVEDIRLSGFSPADQRRLVALAGRALLFLVMLYLLWRLYQYRQQSYTDPLTGLQNQRGYRRAIEKAMRAARRARRPLALVILDLDDFKRVNDEHGHLAGDALLREMAARLRRVVRASDFVGRYAGDEFVAILRGADAAGAREVTARLVQELEQASVEVDGRALSLRVGASVGVAVLDPERPGSPDDLFRRADRALYQSKFEGKSRVRFAVQVAG